MPKLTGIRARQEPRGGSGEQLRAFKAELFKALAHPARIRVLEVLTEGERSVGQE